MTTTEPNEPRAIPPMTWTVIAPLRVMLDLETLGTRAGCVILTVGAVTFGNGVIGRAFYRRVNAETCVNAGLVIDAETVIWWLSQSAEARAEVAKPGEALTDVLWEFARWLGCGAQVQTVACELWSKGAAFDIPILDAAYVASGYRVPWEPFGDRCYRTAAAMHREVPFVRTAPITTPWTMRGRRRCISCRSRSPSGAGSHLIHR